MNSVLFRERERGGGGREREREREGGGGRDIGHKRVGDEEIISCKPCTKKIIHKEF